MMKAARIHGYNEPAVVDDASVPEIGADEVLVRVGAASLNPLDLKVQKGYMHDFFPVEFPYVLGTDLAGTVEQLGSEVEGWSLGDRVLARLDPTRGGALAEFAGIPSSALVEIPESLSLELAAGVPTTGGTAWQALFEVADLKEGQSVLVHAGAGGVGSFAIQFARAAGARVIATASGPGVEIARRIGADEVIDYQATDFSEGLSNLDVVLDTVGGDTQIRSVAVLRPGGRLIVTPEPPGEETVESAKARDVTSEFVFHGSDAKRLKTVVENLSGKEVLVDRTVSLDALSEALSHQAAGHAHGKILFAF